MNEREILLEVNGRSKETERRVGSFKFRLGKGVTLHLKSRQERGCKKKNGKRERRNRLNLEPDVMMGMKLIV